MFIHTRLVIQSQAKRGRQDPEKALELDHYAVAHDDKTQG